MTKTTKPKLVFGVGVNDAGYVVSPLVDGKQHNCPFYLAWIRMLTRCYYAAYKDKSPTYADCSVSPEWLTFSNFKKWMETQDWEGLELDKDILIPGNKLYSEETCVFVSPDVNKLMNSCAASRGEYPLGVYFNKATKKFMALVGLYGKQTYLGLFNTPEEGCQAYIEAKSEHIREVADTQSEPVRAALHRHADLLEAGL